MLDKDLAELYQVSTGRLNEGVKRNINRFPIDFMFQLTEYEFKNLISQIAISSWGGRRNLPYVFTEYGVLMLSSVLKSEIAIYVNIQIMRVYTRMRKLILTNQEILLKLEQLEKQSWQNKVDIQVVFDYLKQLLIPVEQFNRRRIGFKRMRKIRYLNYLLKSKSYAAFVDIYRTRLRLATGSSVSSSGNFRLVSIAYTAGCGSSGLR
jgi:hypothetical protein